MQIDPAQVPKEPSIGGMRASSAQAEQVPQSQDEQPTSQAPTVAQGDLQADGDGISGANVPSPVAAPDVEQEHASHPPTTTQSNHQETSDKGIAENMPSSPSLPAPDQSGPSHSPESVQNNHQRDDEGIYKANIPSPLPSPSVDQEQASYPASTTQSDRQEVKFGWLAENVSSSHSVPALNKDKSSNLPKLVQNDLQLDGDEVFQATVSSSLLAPGLGKERASHPSLTAQRDTQQSSGEVLEENVSPSSPVTALERVETSHLPRMPENDRQGNVEEVLKENLPSSLLISDIAQEDAPRSPIVAPIDSQKADDKVPEQPATSSSLAPDKDQAEAFHLPVSTHSDLKAVGMSFLEDFSLPTLVGTQNNGQEARSPITEETVPASPHLPTMAQDDRQADDDRVFEEGVASSPPIPDLVHDEPLLDDPDHDWAEANPRSTSGPLDTPVNDVPFDFKKAHQVEPRVGSESTSFEDRFRSLVNEDIFNTDDDPYRTIIREHRPPSIISISSNDTDSSSPSPLNSPMKEVAEPQTAIPSVPLALMHEEKKNMQPPVANNDNLTPLKSPLKEIAEPRTTTPSAPIALMHEEQKDIQPPVANNDSSTPLKSPSKKLAEPWTTAQSAPFALMHEEQQNVQRPIAEKDKLTQLPRDTLQKEGVLSETEYQRVTEGASLAEIASDSLRRCSVATEEPIIPPPIRTAPLTAPFITSDEYPPIKRPARSYTAPLQAVVGKFGDPLARPTTAGRVQSQKYAPPYSVPRQNSLPYQNAMPQRHNSLSLDTTTSARQSVSLNPQQASTFPSPHPQTPTMVYFPSPRDLQMDAAPTTNQLPPFNLQPPAHPIPHSTSPSQPSNMIFAMNHQTPLPQLPPRPAPHYQLPSRHTPSGLFYAMPPNTQTHHGSGEFPNKHPLISGQHRAHNAQAPQPHDLPQNHTRVQGQVGYSCPYCPSIFGKPRLRDDHIKYGLCQKAPN
ncbi:hypothetical protein EDB81DRAFT_785335 [Dactylonectria macrodidyma]|uniref:Uncharacterized protein n=1 Tax=Dactylonectria macrodidyma TaxID=307937 RepID=A0A9P9FGA0_9HYPO|nr:hypothetical protein EDB81DRAFT_785335 [Dactylonectria macrodidyma]